MQPVTVSLLRITKSDRSPFLQMAEQHFRDLNPNFVPHQDWKENYFERVSENPRVFADWVLADGKRAGFVLFGLEEHRFLPRLTGMIYELYILPEFRRMGIAKDCARKAIRQLQDHSPSKIQLEVMDGNKAAEALWHSLGFERVSSRLVLKTRR
jgi:ribosomal protein S18 acetylase RimI-like enzyme